MARGKITIRCGIDNCGTKIRGTEAQAMKELERHRLSFHPNWQPPKGSIIDRRERLD